MLFVSMESLLVNVIFMFLKVFFVSFVILVVFDVVFNILFLMKVW